MIPRPRAGPIIALLLLLLPLLLSPAWAVTPRADPPPPSGNPKVLILVGPQYGLPIPDALIPPLLRTLTDGGHGMNDIFVEFLDLHRHNDPEYRAAVLALLRYKLADSGSGMVIAGNLRAVDFVVREGQDLLPEAPMVIPILEEQPDWRHVSRKLVTLTSRDDAQGTLRLALDLFSRHQPGAVLIMGKDDSGAPFLEPLYQDLAGHPSLACRIYFEQLPLYSINLKQ